MDRKEWALQVAEGNEFEQYDTFDTAYVIAHVNREVVGGARLKRTDTTMGQGKIVYSYMIRDACLGLLPGLPKNLCNAIPPMDRSVWELTRMVVNGPRDVTRMILQATNDFLCKKDAASVLFLGSPAFLRMARSWDWPAHQLGPVTGNADGRFQVIECPVRRPQ